PSGPLTLASPGSSDGTNPTTPRANQPASDLILGHLPVASPFLSGGPQQSMGPAGFTPQQIQTAYGLSTGSALNDNIHFGGIKGDGTGQTIAIFEVGSNPAFVDTSDPNYGTSALAVFDQTFGIPDPPSLSFYDQAGKPITPSNPGPGNL